ncbi:unnamed protein product [Bursaphelenchus okinawaensis]|uniref:Ras-GEF domain-containing protein n=1 Tax=Bursaphelenchus okinawaensis TaxID=465554 RepID=A0A811LPD5_9BILA|nr:unnamed protein product [Bursaphelenchus okinawaensis]CAG9127109.1 unnamed protein product [Bursaphelenchus okinawaensis]
MTISKYWGDEKKPDAVYSVYLKKVRYVPPPGYDNVAHYRPIDPDSHFLTDSGNDLLQWETIRERVIKAGTLERLVDSLIGSDDKLDSRHFNVFFATYRAYAKPSDVANVLFNKCQEIRDCDGHGALRSIFICWMDMYAEDFYENEKKFNLLNKVIDFSKLHKWADLKVKARKLRERFRRVADEGGLASQIMGIAQYTYSLDYDPNDPNFAQEHAQRFDISKDNCVQIAEQLTFWDAILFREVRPFQCQGAIWGKRNKEHAENVYSVKATIDQFNSVSKRVMTSVVLPECRPEFRAKIIEKWIEIAKELKSFKNYSSLKAILSSLQSEPVYRIKSAWSCVSKSSNLTFRDLTSTFERETQDDTNDSGLESQGSGRREKKIQQCRRSKSDVNLTDSQGLVPYLGNFLTDLTMIDQAYPDTVEDNLINFEKRRREFEVMAKIRLFQSAARGYTVPMDAAFCAWFYYLPSLNENDCFYRSLEVEPGSNNGSGTPDFRRKNQPLRNSGGSKPSSFTKIFGQITDEFVGRSSFQQTSNDSGIVSEEGWITREADSTRLSSEFSPFMHSTPKRDDNMTLEDSAFSCCSTPQPQTSGGLNRKMVGHNSSSSHASSASSGSMFSSSVNQTLPPKPQQRNGHGTNLNFYLARVGLDESIRGESSEGANYKCIKVENGDRISTLVERALEKHIMEEENKDDYCLVQLLPDGSEFRLPDHCNPFYAVAPDPTSPMLNFLLKKRESDDQKTIAPSAKKLNRQKRSNLLRWSSGYL